MAASCPGHNGRCGARGRNPNLERNPGPIYGKRCRRSCVWLGHLDTIRCEIGRAALGFVDSAFLGFEGNLRRDRACSLSDGFGCPNHPAGASTTAKAFHPQTPPVEFVTSPICKCNRIYGFGVGKLCLRGEAELHTFQELISEPDLRSRGCWLALFSR